MILLSLCIYRCLEWFDWSQQGHCSLLGLWRSQRIWLWHELPSAGKSNRILDRTKEQEYTLCMIWSSSFPFHSIMLAVGWDWETCLTSGLDCQLDLDCWTGLLDWPLNLHCSYHMTSSQSDVPSWSHVWGFSLCGCQKAAKQLFIMCGDSFAPKRA